MTQQHDDAFLALIRTADPTDALFECVYDGALRNPDGSRMTAEQIPKRYVVVYSNRGIIRPHRFTGYARRRQITYWVHSVGLNKRQADGVAERVLSRVLNRRLTVDGWVCEPVQKPASEPVQIDESVKPPRFYGVDQYDLFTTPIH